MVGKGEKAMDPTRVEDQDTWASSNSLETHLVRKWGDIGQQLAQGYTIYIY